MADSANAVKAIGDYERALPEQVTLNDDGRGERLTLTDPLDVLRHVIFIGRQQIETARAKQILGCVVNTAYRSSPVHQALGRGLR